LQVTGIAFNVILVRSSAKRDQEFTTFDQNERTTILGTFRFAPGQSNEQHEVISDGSMAFGSTGQSKSRDVELAVMTVNSEDKQSSQTGFYPVGIKVVRSVVQS
jgi:hypothetical protein